MLAHEEKIETNGEEAKTEFGWVTEDGVPVVCVCVCVCVHT